MRLPFPPFIAGNAGAVPSRWRQPLVIVIVTGLAAASTAGARQFEAVNPDPVVGQWRLEVLKSKYSPGPGPKSETRTYKVTKEGIKAAIVRTQHDGRVQTIEYDADYDSVNHVIGTPDYDAVRLTRISAYVSEATLSHAGRLFGTARREIAKDGMTMVITFRQDAETKIHNVAHYVRVTP